MKEKDGRSGRHFKAATERLDAMIGKKFGHATMTGWHRKPKKQDGKLIAWLEMECDCVNKTKFEVRADSSAIKKPQVWYSCGCEHRTMPSGEKSARYRGFGDIPGRFISGIRNAANKRGIPLLIDVEYLWNLFLEQGRKCRFTGLPLWFHAEKGKAYDFSRANASVDRIDSKRFYEKGNIQWVHKWINMMKQDMTDQEFIEFSVLVAKHCVGNDLSGFIFELVDTKSTTAKQTKVPSMLDKDDTNEFTDNDVLNYCI